MMEGIPLWFSALFLSNFRIVGTAGRSHDGSCFAAVFLRLFSAANILLEQFILNHIFKEKTKDDNQTGTYQ